MNARNFIKMYPYRTILPPRHALVVCKLWKTELFLMTRHHTFIYFMFWWLCVRPESKKQV